MKKNILLIALLAVSFNAIAMDPSQVPENKKSTQNLYVTALEVPALKKSKQAVMFDIRTPEEVAFLGMADAVDFNVPFKISKTYDQQSYNKDKATYDLASSPTFVTDIEIGLKKAGQLSKDTTIILICRSGDRTSSAATLLAKSGYKNVYTVVDGYEGDLNKVTQRRDVNGWKNSNLPWSYTLDAKKLYINFF